MLCNHVARLAELIFATFYNRFAAMKLALTFIFRLLKHGCICIDVFPPSVIGIGFLLHYI
jgi:hypothetical protein